MAKIYLKRVYDKKYDSGCDECFFITENYYSDNKCWFWQDKGYCVDKNCHYEFVKRVD